MVTQRGVIRDGEAGCFPQLSELGRDFIFLQLARVPGSERGPCSRNWPVLGLIDWLGRQEAVNAGLVVFTDGIQLGGGMLPSKDGEADNDRMHMGASGCRHGCSLVVIYKVASTPWDPQGITY